MHRRSLVAAIALPVLLHAAGPAPAAESYDNCTGFIDSVPAVISAKGTWCLRRNLATAMASGAAIDIRTSNVVIDCNDFKIGGLAAGTATETSGILARSLQNIVVRQCTIRGFLRGIDIDGFGANHLVEDNRLEGNTGSAIHVSGEGSVVRGNLVYGTGGSPASAASGIETWFAVDVIGNTISGVVPGPGEGPVHGILQHVNEGGTIAGNRIRGLAASAGGSYGIFSERGVRGSIRRNDLIGPATWAVHCSNASEMRSRGNLAYDFDNGISGCVDDGSSVLCLDDGSTVECVDDGVVAP